MNVRSLTALLFLFAPVVLCSCNLGTSGKVSSSGAAVRSPTFTYAKATEGGCGDLFFHKGTTNQLEVLWIAADKTKLKLPDKGSKTFDLAAAPDGLQAAVDLWPTAPKFAAYCNDISSDTKREATWRAKKGTITITIHEPQAGAKPGARNYKASAKLEGVVFEDEAGHQATLKEETITEVLVGWYAG